MPNTCSKARPQSDALHNRLVIGALVVLLGAVYLTTLLPGVSNGDSAELQWVSPFLGICHPPGYQIEVTFGKLFSMLPIGPGIAWRINFMMAVFGTVGAMALYGAVRRICRSKIAAIVAATTLAFSSIYWSHCLHAEAYVFYSTFLLLGIYAAVRFVQSDKAGWLYLTAFFTGACVADRSSELFVMPAFFALWLFVRKRIHLGVLRILLALVIFVLPFIYTTSFFLIRRDWGLFYKRDHILRAEITSGKKFEPPRQSPFEKVRWAARSCLGLTYAEDADFNTQRVKGSIDRYAWLLSGLGAFGDRYPPTDRRSSAQGRGTSIGALGLLLVVTALILGRRQYGWVTFGLVLFLGNLVFILWHSRWDNLTFTIPGLIGLSFLAGLATAVFGTSLNRRRRIVFQAACLAAPIFLVVTNYRLLDKSTQQEQKLLEYHHRLAAAPLPQNSVIIEVGWPGMTYRYLYYVEAGRTDINVMLSADPERWAKMVDYFSSRGRPVFVRGGHVPPAGRMDFLKRTPKGIAELGFVLVNPVVLKE